MKNSDKIDPLIIAEIDKILHSFKLNSLAFDRMLENLKAARINMDNINQEIVTDKHVEYIKAMDELSKVTDDYLGWKISAENHDATRLKLIKKRNKALEDMLSHNLSDDAVVTLTRMMVDIVKGQFKPIEKMKIDEQKMLIKAMFKEIKVKDSKVEYVLSNAFEDIIELNKTITIPKID